MIVFVVNIRCCGYKKSPTLLCEAFNRQQVLLLFFFLYIFLYIFCSIGLFVIFFLISFLIILLCVFLLLVFLHFFLGFFLFRFGQFYIIVAHIYIHSRDGFSMPSPCRVPLAAGSGQPVAQRIRLTKTSRSKVAKSPRPSPVPMKRMGMPSSFWMAMATPPLPLPSSLVRMMPVRLAA